MLYLKKKPTIVFKVKLISIIILSFCSWDLHARPVYSVADSLRVPLLKVKDIGPAGHSYFQLTPIDNQSANSIYPQLTLPKNGLTNIKYYYHIYNEPQFYYQAYLAGKIDRTILLGKLKAIDYNPSDTAKLSKQPIRCGVSIYEGIDSKGVRICGIDANNNGDFNDDPNFVLPNIKTPYLTVQGAIPVFVDFHHNKKSYSEEIYVSLAINRFDALSLAIPLFYYEKFTLNDKEFVVCAQYYKHPNKSVFIVEDGNYFGGLRNAKKYKVGDTINIADATIEIADIDGIGSNVTLKTASVNKLRLSGSVQKNATNNQLLTQVANQTNFLAPELHGKDLLQNSRNISLDQYKGKYVFIDFWGPFCAPCIADFSKLKEVYSFFDRSKLEIIGVVDERITGSATDILRKNQISWPNILMRPNGTTQRGYENIFAFPTTYLVDPEGRIIDVGLDGNALMSRMSKLIKK